MHVETPRSREALRASGWGPTWRWPRSTTPRSPYSQYFPRRCGAHVFTLYKKVEKTSGTIVRFYPLDVDLGVLGAMTPAFRTIVRVLGLWTAV